MTSWILPALLLQFAAPVVSGPKDLVLDVDVFRGSPTRAGASSAASSAPTSLLSPWASGWSHEPDRLTIEIRDVAALDRVNLVLRDHVYQVKRTGTIRGSDYWVAVRFLYSTSKNIEIEARIVTDEDAESGNGGMSPVRFTGELEKTLVVRGGPEHRPLFAAITVVDPLTHFRCPKCLPARSLVPIQPKYPEPARKTTLPGTIVVRALIDANGLLVEPFVERSLHPDLDAAALEAVRNGRFRPATIDGKPFASMMTVACRFFPAAR